MDKERPYSNSEDGSVDDDARDGDEEGDVHDRKALTEPVKGVKREARPVIDSQLEEVMDVVTPMLPFVEHIIMVEEDAKLDYE
tara:strand:- start:150 stop:398 length:249 start_codon:yes stop_codon:yes gene_type:complete